LSETPWQQSGHACHRRAPALGALHPSYPAARPSNSPAQFCASSPLCASRIEALDLGGQMTLPRRLRRLAPVTLDAVSPTQHVPTTYTIWPVAVPVPPGSDNPIRDHLRGEWLTASEAMSCSELSPTARPVLEILATALNRPSSDGTAHDDDWTQRLIAARDSRAELFGPLFEEMKPWLTERLRACGSTRALAYSPHDLDDVLQTVAINAWTYLKAFDPHCGSAGVWLWTLSRNCAVSLLRRRSVRSTGSLFSRDGDEYEVPDSRSDSTELAGRHEQIQVLQRRLETVLDRCGSTVRRAWTMRFTSEDTYADIAEKLSVPIGTVATWIRRVKSIVRGTMECVPSF
jgi:RNA polymerase sigma factor (sigma-70 family)